MKFDKIINPSNTKGFGTTSDTKRGWADPPYYLMTPLM